MPEQRMHSALAPIDVLTRAELEATLTHRFDAFIRDWYRGEDYVEYNSNAGGAVASYLIPGPDSGFAWALKLISVDITMPGTVDVYLGDSNTTAPIGELIVGTTGAAVFTWSSNQVVMKDQRNIFITVNQGFISAVKVIAKQVPTEMIGKL